MGEKGAVVSKKQLSDEFPYGFRACEETLKVEETAIGNRCRCHPAGPLFDSQSMMLKKMENNVGARTQPCLTPLEMGKLPDRDPLCFT